MPSCLKTFIAAAHAAFVDLLLNYWYLQRHMNLNDKSDQGSEGKRVMNVRICHTPALMVLITAVSLSFLISSLDFRQEA